MSKRFSWVPHLRLRFWGGTANGQKAFKRKLAGQNDTGFSNPCKKGSEIAFCSPSLPNWACHLNIYDIMIQSETQNDKPPEWAPRCRRLLAVSVGASLREATAMLLGLPISCPKPPNPFMGWHVVLVGIETWNLHKFRQKIANVLAWSQTAWPEVMIEIVNVVWPDWTKIFMRT